MPHLYPLFPGFEITRETDPVIFEACRVALEKRQQIGQDARSGWALAHAAGTYARLNDGDRALDCLDDLIRSSTGINLFTYHNDWRHMGLTVFWNFKDRIFQIDANFGLTATVLEMLVYSNRDIIGVLPALPAKWAKGSVSGILCRGGAEVDIDWDMPEGRITLKLTAKRTRTCTLRFPGAVASVVSDLAVEPSELGDHCREVAFEAGREYRVEVGLGVRR